MEMSPLSASTSTPSDRRNATSVCSMANLRLWGWWVNSTALLLMLPGLPRPVVVVVERSRVELDGGDLSFQSAPPPYRRPPRKNAKAPPLAGRRLASSDVTL